MGVLKAFQASVALLSPEMRQSGRYAVAFSGGVDSSALLHRAVAYFGQARCVALHIHHGLSAQADNWQYAAQAVAERLGVRFVAHRVAVDAASGKGIEAEARKVRYSALSALCQREDASVLLLGHHADDQAETVWLQLLRGGGLPGIAAMPAMPVERLWPQDALTEGSTAQKSSVLCRVKEKVPSKIILLRPLLSVPRSVIQDYAQEHHLTWIEDDSNSDVRYARNALRHDVLPQVAKHFPAYRDASVRLARYAAQAQSLLNDLAEIDLLALRSQPEEGVEAEPIAHALSHGAFQALLHRSFARAVNVLRYWMRIEQVPSASCAWLDETCKQLDSSRTVPLAASGGVLAKRKGAAWQIPHAGWYLSIYRDGMRWEQPQVMALHSPESLTFKWQGETHWMLAPWRGSIRFVRTLKNEVQSVPAAWLRATTLTAQTRRGGERVRLCSGAPSRTLKKCFQQASVPAWQRTLPLIYMDDMLLFVPYVGMNLGNIALTESEYENSPEGFVRLEWCVESL